MDGAGSWWADHWSEVVAVVLAVGFLALVGTAVRSSLMLGHAATNRRVRHRRATDATAVSGSEWRTAFHRLEQRVTTLERMMEESAGETSQEETGVLATLSRSTSEIQSRVERLSGAGHSIEEIARELDEPVGRIELILNLRRASGQS